MIYLFNKIHLKPLALIDNRNKISRIVLTDSIPQLTDESESILINQSYGELHFKEHSYQDFLDKHFSGSDNSFLTWLTVFPSGNRLEIYMSNQDFYLFAIKWYKSFLSYMPVETAYLLFRLVYQKAHNLHSLPYTGQAYFTNRDAQVCCELAQSLPSKEQFIKDWEESSVFSVSIEEYAVIRKSFALEFQIANIALYGDHHHSSKETKEKVVSMARKWHMSMLMDMKIMSLRRLSLLPDFDIHADTVTSWVERHPEYSFLRDPDFHEDNAKEVYAKYDLEQLKQTYISQMTRFDYENVERMAEEFKFFKADLTYEDVMEIELNSQFDRQIFGRWEYAAYINLYLLDIVINAIRDNDTKLLSHFVIT